MHSGNWKNPSDVINQLYTSKYKYKDPLHACLKMQLLSVSSFMSILLAKISVVETCKMQPHLLPLHSYPLADVCGFVSTVAVQCFCLGSLDVVTQFQTNINIQIPWCQAKDFLKLHHLIQSLPVWPFSVCRRVGTAGSVSLSPPSSALNSSSSLESRMK